MRKAIVILFLLLSVNSFAYRYWYVAGNGSGNWSGNFYADSTSLVTPASDPTSTDDVYFGALSGTGTCTITSNSNCKNLTMSGFGGTLTNSGSNYLSFYGDVILGGTISGSSIFWRYKNTTGTNTFRSNSKSIQILVIDGSGGTLQLVDALSVSQSTGGIQLTNGTLDLNGQTVSCVSVSLNSGTKTLTSVSGVATVTVTGGSAINFSTNATGFTYTGTNIDWIFTATSAVFYGNGNSFRNISFTGANLYSLQLYGVNTIKGLTIQPSSLNLTCILYLYNPHTISDSLKIIGYSSRYRIQVTSSDIGTARTITNNGSKTIIKNCDFRDITGAGTASWDLSSNTSVGNALGNSNITFPTARTLYWRKTGGTGSWSDSTCWSGTWSGSGGSGLNNQGIPLAQDSVCIGKNAITATGKTITMDCRIAGKGINVGDSLENNPTFTLTGISSIEIYGSLNCKGFTRAGSASIYFNGRGSHNIYSNGITYASTIYINSYGGTYTIKDAFTTSQDISQNSGTITIDNVNVSVQGFIQNSSSGLTSNLGTDTINLTGIANQILQVFSANTVSASNTTIRTVPRSTISGTPTIVAGGKTYKELYIYASSPSTSNFYKIQDNNSTFTTLKISAGNMVQFTSTSTFNINSLTADGTLNNPIIIFPTANTFVATLNDANGGTNTITYCNVMGVNATGGTFNLGDGCMDGGGTTGWTPNWTKPKVISAFNLNGANTDATGYATMTSTSVNYGAGISGQGAVYTSSTKILSNNVITTPNTRATLMCWINTTDFSATRFIVNYNTGVQYPLNLGMPTTGYVMGYSNSFASIWTATAPAVISGAWNLIGFTTDWQNPTASLYFVCNGKVVNPTSGGNVTSILRTTTIGLGAVGVGNQYVGSLDEVRIINGLVTPAYFKNEYSYRKGFMQ